MKIKKMVALGTALTVAFSLSGCGNSDKSEGVAAVNLPSIDSIEMGTDYQDITANIKVLTNRTDIVDTIYKGYAEQFMKLYPNITVEYEAVTDYEESLNLRLPTGDWGDICYIPTSVAKSELSEYFSPLGDFSTLNEIYNFLSDKNYGGMQYGIPNGGTAGGGYL
jgi:ABC-type glycerol-3-phosphate transport system substrate-binding protein